LSLTNQEIGNHNPRPTKRHNLSTRLRTALRRLQQDDSIIIKPADKGGATVIWDKNDYLQEATRQLENPNHYRKLERDLTSKINKSIINTINSEINLGHLPNFKVDDLIIRKPRTPIFYMLPKIHKANTPGRPIVSNTYGPTEPISKYLDSLLRTKVIHTKSYIKDTTDFLQKIQEIGHIPSTAILCTVDVTALYTNIPHLEGIEASLTALSGLQKPPRSTLETLMKIVLSSNCFEFNNEYYEQIQGTAMGTSMAPNYANLFMDQFEQRFLATQTKKPIIWLRFIDDIFMVWLHSEESLFTFLENLNSFHPTIKFTSCHSYTEVNFLDLTVINKDNTLITKNYHKPTDANTYLHYKSCHPISQKNSIPYSQFLRMNRNNTKQDDAKNSMDKLSKAFQQRGYPEKVIKESQQKVAPLTQLALLQNNTTRESKQMITYVTTYNPCGPHLMEILNKNINILQGHPHTSHLKKDNFRIAFRRPKNLRDILVHSRISTDKPPPGNFKCNVKRCKCCKHLNTHPTFTDSLQRKTYKTKGHITCLTDHVIYLIECSLCGKAYVGQTSQTLKERLTDHITDIHRKNRETNIAKHFKSPGHSEHQLNIRGICKAPRDTSKRLALESSWINLLSTYAPRGINIKS
jgi:hypothetical protein